MAAAPEYYCMDFGRLPDELYKPEVPLEEWQKHLKTAGKKGFAAGSLREIAPIRMGELLERLIVYPLYMIMNAAPFMMPPVLWAASGFRGCLYFVLGLLGVHGICVALNPMGSMKSAPYIFTERHIQKYNSIKWVWPKSLQPPNVPGPKIFCTIPHGLAPIGIVAYPGWSKLFGDRLNRPTAAPAVLKLPVISYVLKKIGYIDASSAAIKRSLNKQENVCIILDGIAGMFQKNNDEELGWVQERKGIVKIALTTGTPLVPVFGFGHSQLWRILVDPFGWLEKISLKLGVSVTPFCGRPFGLLPFGPPYREPVLLAFGEPIEVPKVEEPCKEQINEYHQKLLDGFQKAFETHKVAYGWPHKTLRLV
mmetsp:Transcript_4929/g.18487  ORF Transcript_4929/g.18487 Transcript_4929/m.18487 type:complete len:365 (-) Transcript_4929:65-1159(-)|eukprot:CAMPEP_0203971154 /NCGR_PEP_ID=MMETSP0359-20131031/98330_1 /ASSEMBLY_ACC=CAM_ASM_000338 /TAXON_ID=268821 /ORGANISM="Scrippsiella Hangoei, Strain SHTV-5" /LENGTH=364 /DNA_ID=CAMNT_0050909121 /DNA_START=62 /DNA_END=1156 /DNA_ORIENTATION=-